MVQKIFIDCRKFTLDNKEVVESRSLAVDMGYCVIHLKAKVDTLSELTGISVRQIKSLKPGEKIEVGEITLPLLDEV